MINKAQLERLFVSAVILAFASLALSIVGIKSQLFQTIQFLLLFFALMSLVVLGFQSKTIQFNANRLKKQIIGWMFSSIFSIAIWSFAQKDLQAIFPVLKGYKKALNTLEPFAIYAAIVFILFALILAIVGARDSKLDRPGFIERTLVYNLSSKIAALPMMFTSIGIFVIATLWTVYHSFTNSRMLPKSEFIGLAQYERLWSSDRWYMSIENLAIYGACSLIFSLFIGFILAALLDQKTRFENTFRTIFLYPFALSFIVTGLVWQWILNPEYGVEKIIRSIGFESFVFNPLYNTDIVIYGILAAGLWQGTGFFMCLMLAGLRGIDQEIWKAAKIDGIPMWKTYIQVVIPMMRPIFITTLVIIAAGIIKVYDLVVAQTSGGPGISSEVPAKYVYDYMFSAQNLGQGFAASTMMLVSVLIVLIPFAYLQFGRRKHD